MVHRLPRPGLLVLHGCVVVSEMIPLHLPRIFATPHCCCLYHLIIFHSLFHTILMHSNLTKHHQQFGLKSRERLERKQNNEDDKIQ